MTPRRIPMEYKRNGSDKVENGWVELLTEPQDFDELEHDFEVTVNLDGFETANGEHLTTSDVSYFDLAGEQ